MMTGLSMGPSPTRSTGAVGSTARRRLEDRFRTGQTYSKGERGDSSRKRTARVRSAPGWRGLVDHDTAAQLAALI